MPRLAFSSVTQLRVPLTDAWSCPLSDEICGCSTRVEYLKSACASHFCWYQVVFVHCILWILKYSYLRFSIKRYIFHAYKTFLARIPRLEKYFFLESAWTFNWCVYNVCVIDCLVLRLAMWHICVFSQQMHVAPSFQWHPGCSTRVEYLKRVCTSHICWYQVGFVHCILCILKYSYLRFSIKRYIFHAYETFLARIPRLEKYFFLESAWTFNCCVYNVGVFHCLVLRLAMWHSCVFSQQMHGLAHFQMTSRMFHACRIPEECVRVTFLLISSSLRPLHPVHLKIFLSQIFYQEVHISRARNFPRAYTMREKYFFLESAWMCNCCVYIVSVFHCLVLRLAMWHSCVFSQQMHGLAHFQMTSRVFHACRIPEECVRVTFLLISTSLCPLHPVYFKIF